MLSGTSGQIANAYAFSDSELASSESPSDSSPGEYGHSHHDGLTSYLWPSPHVLYNSGGHANFDETEQNNPNRGSENLM
jgi:hypothetical protein